MLSQKYFISVTSIVECRGNVQTIYPACDIYLFIETLIYKKIGKKNIKQIASIETKSYPYVTHNSICGLFVDKPHI